MVAWRCVQAVQRLSTLSRSVVTETRHSTLPFSDSVFLAFIRMWSVLCQTDRLVAGLSPPRFTSTRCIRTGGWKKCSPTRLPGRLIDEAISAHWNRARLVREDRFRAQLGNLGEQVPPKGRF